MDKEQIAVLVATYNGEKYLTEQIKSLLIQKKVDVTIYIHDDYSKDGSFEIINRLSSEFPDKIKVLNSDKNLGVVRTYQFLLDNVEADYYFFCDQDDVWYDDKIIQEVKILVHSDNRPALVYSDLEVVDSDLNTITNSMFTHMNVKNSEKTSMLLTQNVITGNTVGFNRALRNLVVNVFRMDNDFVLMHDGWLGLIASIYGDLIFLNKPTVKYRQHANNVIGARKSKLNKLFKVNKLRKAIVNTILQAELLDKKMSLVVDTNSKSQNIVHSYATILNYTPKKRLRLLIKNQLKKQGLLRNIVFVILILTEKRAITN
ncbi:glycosyltransferase family 2 protein [Leuconostoc gelidum subsp. gelidum]|uniref:glycosyltransferase family 2 protein n=1 Tax=Leuconostoc gelidum TaxID=1244 RepID=UPI001CC349FD|nr:glycosyltransferase family 2 protein [Leuconostoc gelidum]MBZ5975034.1 glycosyltransferase family 2 protein [Leuconostoc gelidum subsp. gelidum]MBZ5978037.1 glycosyltransferase family 2 protein [Leuconostoc gelidum subsp. gelidum]